MKQRFYALTDTQDIVSLGWHASKPIQLIGHNVPPYEHERLPLWSEPTIRMLLNDDDLYRLIEQAKECLNKA